MGFFAFKTADTGKNFVSQAGDEIPNGVFKATLITPNNERFTGTYDGYGTLADDKGNKVDVFAAVSTPFLVRAIAESHALDTPLRNSFFGNYEENRKLIKIVEHDNGKNFPDTTPIYIQARRQRH